MIKNIRLQILMGLDQYNQIQNYATDQQIKYRNDSDLFRKILFTAIQQQEGLLTENYILRSQIKDQKINLDQLTNANKQLEIAAADLRKDLDIAEKNLAAKNKKYKKKK